MKTFEEMVRPEIRSLQSYSFAPPLLTGLRAKLDFNEAPVDIPDDLKRLVLERISHRRWAQYPEFGSGRIRRALSRRSGRPEEEIIPGNGSGELILAALSVLSRPEGRLLLASPTFSLYDQIAAITGLSVEKVPCVSGSFAVDEDAYLSRLAGSAHVVPLLCSPNNPTGGTVSREFVRQVARISGIVLLDQAYVEFSEPEDDLSSLLDEIPGLVIFRTLSKAFSAAGFRIGYCMARKGASAEIRKAVLPFNIDLCAEELAVAVLENPEFSARNVEAVRQERERVHAAIRLLGAEAAPSRANFIFMRLPGWEAAELAKELFSGGILVRAQSSTPPGWIRVTVGSPTENDLFLKRLEEIACHATR